jgi:heme exporter protein A
LIEVVNLSCARGDRTLFRELSFAVQAGELLHVTGPNGCGKTTLLRTLCGLTRPIEGEIRWSGSDTRRLSDEYRTQLAYVGHHNGIQGELTPPENLRSVGDLAGAADATRIEAALTRVALDPYRNFPSKILSQGQKRRLALARLLVLGRPLWVLDEPLSALDVRSVEFVTDILTEHLEHGGMAILTSHQELEIEVRMLRTLCLED